MYGLLPICLILRFYWITSWNTGWRQHDICSYTWWRHQWETFSALLAICAGNSPVTGEFPTQRPVTRSFDVFFDLRLNQPLGKQWWSWWFETLLRPLWRHCNGHKFDIATMTYLMTIKWIGKISRFLFSFLGINRAKIAQTIHTPVTSDRAESQRCQPNVFFQKSEVFYFHTFMIIQHTHGSINFIICGRKPSHLEALSLKLQTILRISSSLTANAKKFFGISNLIYSLGHLLVDRISFAKDSPSLTKKVLNLLAIIFPSLITSPLHLKFVLNFRLLMIDFTHLPLAAWRF